MIDYWWGYKFLLCLLKIIIVHKVILECVKFYNSKIYIPRVWSYKCVAWILWQKLVYIFVGHSSIPKIEYHQSMNMITYFVFLWNISNLFEKIFSLMNFDLAKYLFFIWIMFELGILILSSLLYLIYCYLLKPTLSTKHFLNSPRITNIKNVYVYLNCHSLSPWNNTQYFFSEYQCFVSMASPFK